MSSIFLIWLQFALCAAVILIAGSKLSRYGQAISHATGIESSWIGLALLASVTSLPELATGISAVTLAQAPDIAVGDVLGSCVFNLVLLAIVDAIHRPASLYTTVRTGHSRCECRPYSFQPSHLPTTRAGRPIPKRRTMSVEIVPAPPSQMMIMRNVATALG